MTSDLLFLFLIHVPLHLTTYIPCSSFLTFYIAVFKTFSDLLNYMNLHNIHIYVTQRSLNLFIQNVVDETFLLFQNSDSRIFLIDFYWFFVQKMLIIIILQPNKTDIKVYFAFNFLKN